MPNIRSVPISDQVPMGDSITDYDRAHYATYLALLDAETTGIPWRVAARTIFGIDPDADPETARRTHSAHLERARFLTKAEDLWAREIERSRLN